MNRKRRKQLADIAEQLQVLHAQVEELKEEVYEL